MYCVAVTFRLHAENFSAFEKRVVQQARDSLAKEPGCSVFDVWTDAGRPNEVFLYEIYDDRAAFDAHLASEHFKSFDAEVADWVADKKVLTWSTKA